MHNFSSQPCRVNENDRDSYPEAYLKIWDYSKKTNGLFSFRKYGGFPGYANEDFQENGGSFLYNGTWQRGVEYITYLKILFAVVEGLGTLTQLLVLKE